MPKLTKQIQKRKLIPQFQPGHKDYAEFKKAFDRVKGDPAQYFTGPIPGPLMRIIEIVMEREATYSFPTEVFPRSIQKYIFANCQSIFCSPDLLAVPLLSVAGAATGRSGRWLRIKKGWVDSSCLWCVCLAESSEGKSPALNAVSNFYIDKQSIEISKWLAEKKEYDKDPENQTDPGKQPTLILSDTTIESLRHDLNENPVLYQNDELSGWSHQMGQYKGGNADRPAWTAFHSHTSCSIGRVGYKIFLKKPFVSVAGMMVPGSVKELNHRGHSDDGFVHRMLIAYPPSMPMVFSNVGVSDELISNYKTEMMKLFEPPEGENILTVSKNAFTKAFSWVNQFHYPEVSGRKAPPWMRAKYKKLFANFWRICLVLHELRRVAETEKEWKELIADYRIAGQTIPEFDPMVVDILTAERSIKVIEYFKDHIHKVQAVLGDDTSEDDTRILYKKFRPLGEISVRDFTHKTSHKRKSDVLAIFAEWERRGFGERGTGERKNQIVFRFNK